MHVPLDLVSAEIAVSHRADAEQAAMRSIARLMHREARMRRRLDRVNGRLAGRIGR